MIILRKPYGKHYQIPNKERNIQYKFYMKYSTQGRQCNAILKPLASSGTHFPNKIIDFDKKPKQSINSPSLV